MHIAILTLILPSGNEKKVNMMGCKALKMLDFWVTELPRDNKMTTFSVIQE